MVEQIGLSYLYLSKRGGVPRMCVGGGDVVKEWFFPRNFVNKAIET